MERSPNKAPSVEDSQSRDGSATSSKITYEISAKRSTESPRKDLLRFKRMIAEIDKRQSAVEPTLESISKAKNYDLGADQIKKYFLHESDFFVDLISKSNSQEVVQSARTALKGNISKLITHFTSLINLEHFQCGQIRSEYRKLHKKLDEQVALMKKQERNWQQFKDRLFTLTNAQYRNFIDEKH